MTKETKNKVPKFVRPQKNKRVKKPEVLNKNKAMDFTRCTRRTLRADEGSFALNLSGDPEFRTIWKA